jgi:hypothetical protein
MPIRLHRRTSTDVRPTRLRFRRPNRGLTTFLQGFYRLRRHNRRRRVPKRFSAFGTRIGDLLGFVFLGRIGRFAY